MDRFAELRKTAVWCYGRLGELAVAGLAEGDTQLTEKGRIEYRDMVIEGYLPSKADAIVALTEIAGDDAEDMWLLMTHESEATR